MVVVVVVVVVLGVVVAVVVVVVGVVVVVVGTVVVFVELASVVVLVLLLGVVVLVVVLIVVVVVVAVVVVVVVVVVVGVVVVVVVVVGTVNCITGNMLLFLSSPWMLSMFSASTPQRRSGNRRRLNGMPLIASDALVGAGGAGVGPPGGRGAAGVLDLEIDTDMVGECRDIVSHRT